MARIATVEQLVARQAALAEERDSRPITLTICSGTCCHSLACESVIRALHRELVQQGLADQVRVRVTGCQGFCEQGPVVSVEPGGVLYCRVTADDARDIVARTLAAGEVVEELLYVDPVTGVRARGEDEIPFYSAQDRVLLGQNRLVDPRSLDDYLGIGGYGALAKVLTTMQPEEVIEEIKASGLRGRGGGGFPTGRKWELCRAAPGDEHYVICNADEGDPGAYMDRSVLEGNPHAVLEGMLIGAYAIGSREGYVYVRNEYPLAVSHSRTAIAEARDRGLLGDHILDSGFSFDVRIVRGAGAFVCGESTALISSVEGKVGEPRPKDVHTVAEGLRQQPSNLNNVETWANVPLIMRHGAEWFAARGTERSKGTKIFALTGHVKNTGLIEVAMGTPLRTIVYDIGGGAQNGHDIKAVQTGGPSGGCLPPSLFHLPVDFDTLAEVGSMVGSGGMVVMDQRTCMVDVARYFVNFLEDESCGKCIPCRLGLERMREIITDIAEGRGRPEQLDLLEDLGATMAATSLCALGKTAPNPVLSTLRYFRDEYDAHINEQRCPAGVCRELIRYSIDEDFCTGCGACRRACPHGAIEGLKKQPHRIDPALCNKCGVCATECKSGAVLVA